MDVSTFADRYFAISIRHLQTAFYLLMLGYVLAVVCFVAEVMWKRHSLRGAKKQVHLCVTGRQK
jgi:hypothetical protein